MTANIFFDRPRVALDRKNASKELFLDFRAQFGNAAMVQNYLMTTYVPASRRWVYKTNAKAGSSSILAFLFALEFGVRFTAHLTSGKDHNPDTALHQMREAHVFEPVLNLPDVTDIAGFLSETPTFTVVRDPAQRVLSAFFYLCSSDKQGSEKFLRDRIRLSALTGFDWTVHSRTPEGFRRFLEFIAIETENENVVAVNNHWRPQWRNVQVDLLKPDLIGRVEDLDGFFRELCTLLNRPFPECISEERRNTQSKPDVSLFFKDPMSKSLIRSLFQRDYDVFGYDPEAI